MSYALQNDMSEITSAPLKDCYLHLLGTEVWAFDLDARINIAIVDLACKYGDRAYSPFHRLRWELRQKGYESSQFQEDENGNLWVSFSLSMPVRFWDGWSNPDDGSSRAWINPLTVRKSI
jgi:hypothetical protein